MARKKNSISSANFLKAYMAACEAEKTYKDFAIEVQLMPNSCYQKVQKLSKDLAGEGVTLPKMRLKPKATSSLKELAAIVRAFETPKEPEKTGEQWSDVE